ncbi:hypothetical protein Agub_g14758 [Astrephomene gubernaculifera]|uniref:Uncharacterized protein n=1 Tax=Astrephomene gubernaculifera TaxID=47775 RepID=A0AAD3E3L7_9CHLO|nr:hypothetical protein Agub_g14758 [Astrephomene gubernaculifera]
MGMYRWANPPQAMMNRIAFLAQEELRLDRDIEAARRRAAEALARQATKDQDIAATAKEVLATMPPPPPPKLRPHTGKTFPQPALAPSKPLTTARPAGFWMHYNQHFPSAPAYLPPLAFVLPSRSLLLVLSFPSFPLLPHPSFTGRSSIMASLSETASTASPSGPPSLRTSTTSLASRRSLEGSANPHPLPHPQALHPGAPSASPVPSLSPSGSGVSLGGSSSNSSVGGLGSPLPPPPPQPPGRVLSASRCRPPPPVPTGRAADRASKLPPVSPLVPGGSTRLRSASPRGPPRSGSGAPLPGSSSGSSSGGSSSSTRPGSTSRPKPPTASAAALTQESPPGSAASGSATSSRRTSYDANLSGGCGAAPQPPGSLSSHASPHSTSSPSYTSQPATATLSRTTSNSTQAGETCSPPSKAQHCQHPHQRPSVTHGSSSPPPPANPEQPSLHLAGSSSAHPHMGLMQHLSGPSSASPAAASGLESSHGGKLGSSSSAAGPNAMTLIHAGGAHGAEWDGDVLEELAHGAGSGAGGGGGGGPSGLQEFATESTRRVVQVKTSRKSEATVSAAGVGWGMGGGRSGGGSGGSSVIPAGEARQLQAEMAKKQQIWKVRKTFGLEPTPMSDRTAQVEEVGAGAWQ